MQRVLQTHKRYRAGMKRNANAKQWQRATRVLAHHEVLYPPGSINQPNRCTAGTQAMRN